MNISFPLFYETDSTLGYKLRSNLNIKLPFFNESLQTNSYGFRDEEFVNNAQDYRIAYFGSDEGDVRNLSFSQSMPEQLEAILNNQCPSEKKFKLYNFSVHGYNLLQKYLLWEFLKKNQTFDLVLISTQSPNDFSQTEAFFNNHVPKPVLSIDSLKNNSFNLTYPYESNFFYRQLHKKTFKKIVYSLGEVRLFQVVFHFILKLYGLSDQEVFSQEVNLPNPEVTYKNFENFNKLYYDPNLLSRADEMLILNSIVSKLRQSIHPDLSTKLTWIHIPNALQAYKFQQKFFSKQQGHYVEALDQELAKISEINKIDFLSLTAGFYQKASQENKDLFSFYPRQNKFYLNAEGHSLGALQVAQKICRQNFQNK